MEFGFDIAGHGVISGATPGKRYGLSIEFRDDDGDGTNMGVPDAKADQFGIIRFSPENLGELAGYDSYAGTYHVWVREPGTDEGAPPVVNPATGLPMELTITFPG